MTDPWDGATPIADLAVDHIGIVVADLGPTLAGYGPAASA
jgi:hypothetical protein